MRDLWLGTETRGAARLGVRTRKVTWFGDQQGLEGKAAYTLLFDREQRLWAANRERIICGDGTVCEFFSHSGPAILPHLGSRRGKRRHRLGRGHWRTFLIFGWALEDL